MYPDSRVLLEVVRGTKQFEKIIGYRSGSESLNSRLEDNHGLRRPKFRGLKAFGILGNLGCIAALLDRFADFVIENVRKLWSQISEGLIRSGKFKVRAAGLEEEAA